MDSSKNIILREYDQYNDAIQSRNLERVAFANSKLPLNEEIYGPNYFHNVIGWVIEDTITNDILSILLLTEHNNAEWSFDLLATVPHMHRKGLATMLIKKMIEEADKRNISIHTIVENGENQNIYLYMKYGFIVDKIIMSSLSAYMIRSKN